MTLLRLSFRNLGRAKLRGLLTVVSVAVSLVAFLLLRAVSAGWTEQVTQTPNNRVVARHKIGWSQSLPVHYVEEVRSLPGVKQAMGGAWAEFRLPGHERDYVETTAVQARPFVDMHYELVAPREQKEAFVANRRGVMVSEELAAQFGWKLGDRFTVLCTTPEAEWELQVETIYHSTRHGFARRGIWFHWEYFNERLPPGDKDRIGIISAEIFEPRDGAQLAKAVDILFDAREDQTFTQEDQALNASFVGMFGAMIRALDVVGVLVLGVVVLILGNTIAMSVRERREELGVLRALGFSTPHLFVLVVGEAASLGLAGGVVGFVASFPIVERGMSRFLEEAMGLPPLQVPLGAAFLALLLGVALGAVAASVPSLRLGRLSVVDALRRVG
jgi:putative ABC transport system permease protein